MQPSGNRHLKIGIFCFSFFIHVHEQERQFLVASIVIEFIVSFCYYIIRDWYLSELNPTTLFLALFIRSQLTSTITMVLIFLPKIYYQHKQVWIRNFVLSTFHSILIIIQIQLLLTSSSPFVSRLYHIISFQYDIDLVFSNSLV